MIKRLSNSDVKELNEHLEAQYGKEFLNKKDVVEENDKIIYVNKEAMFFYYDSRIAPTLKLILKNPFLKKITVDMGAVKFIVSGADVMRPGVLWIENGIKKDELVIIQDVNNKKPLALGVALFDAEDMRKQTGGKVVKNIHWVGDEIWKISP
jgi:PUA domain protein